MWVIVIMRISRRFIATLMFFIVILALIPPEKTFARFTALPDFYGQDPDNVNPGSWPVDMYGDCDSITLSLSQPQNPYIPYSVPPEFVEYTYARWTVEAVRDFNDTLIPLNETGDGLIIGDFYLNEAPGTQKSNTFNFTTPLEPGAPFYAVVRYTIVGGEFGDDTGTFEVGDFDHPYWGTRANDTSIGTNVEFFCNQAVKDSAPTVSIIGDYVRTEGSSSTDQYLVQLQLDKPSTEDIWLDLQTDDGGVFPGTYTTLVNSNGYRVSPTYDDNPCANEFDDIQQAICEEQKPDYTLHLIPAGQTYSEAIVHTRFANITADEYFYEATPRIQVIRASNAFIGTQATKYLRSRNDDGCANLDPSFECGYVFVYPGGSDFNDRDQVSFTVANLKSTDIDPNTGVATFTVNLVDSTGANVNPYDSVVISYGTSAVTPTDYPDAYATANVDFQSTSGTVTFGIGETSKTVDIPLLVDAPGDENLEIFNVTFSKTSIDGGTPLDADSVTVGAVIPDTATLPVASLSGVPTLNEGDSGTTNFTFTVNLSKAAIGDQSVNYGVIALGSTADVSDFVGGVLPSGSITIANGATSGTITIPVSGDTVYEPDETFEVDITSVSSGLERGALYQQQGFITNDDPPAVNLFGAPPITEANAETNSIRFTVVAEDNVVGDQTVDYAVTPSGVNPVNASDFGGTLPSGTVTILDGQSSVEIAIPYVDDAIVEPDETFTLTITPTGSGIQAGTPLSLSGTVTNDDSATVTVSDASGLEDSGVMTFTVSVDNAVQDGFSIEYYTGNGTADAMTGDYIIFGTYQTMNFNGVAGENYTFDVQITPDAIVELDETLIAEIMTVSKSNIDISDNGTGTIINDDSATVTVEDVSGVEASGSLMFTLTLDSAVQGGLDVSYSTSDGTATSADNDYDASVGLLSFTGNLGETETVTVPITDDNTVEPDETFTLTLGTSTLLDVTANDTATGTIENDDSATVTIEDVSITEGDAGTQNLTFTATVDNAVVGGFSVNYATSDGTATTADNDYDNTVGSLTFVGNAGETQTFDVVINGDTKVESNQDFTATLSNSSNADVIATDSAIGTILNDDSTSISIDDVSQAENSGAFEFTVSLSNESDTDVTVDYTTNDGTATTADGDYTASSAALTFVAGELSKTVSVTVNDDSKVEADETFTVGLSNAVGATIMDNHGVGTITNDDSASVTIEDVTQPEGNAASSTFTFTATLNAAVDGGVSVNYSTADGTATVAGGDYAAASGTLTFAGTAGETQVFAVTVNGDTEVEANETFSVLLSGVSNANVDVSDTAIGTILNDEQGLLLNGGFETPGDKAKFAESWKPNILSLNNDRRKCNKDKTGDGIADKIFSAEGECAFRFNFNDTVILSNQQKLLIHIIRRIRQPIDVSGINAGDTLSFSGLVKANNLERKAKIIVKVVYGPNRPADIEKIKFVLDQGSYDYQQLTDSLVLSRVPEKIVVLVKAGRSKGTFWIDAFDLKLIETSVAPAQTRGAQEPIDLPEAPSNFRD